MYYYYLIIIIVATVISSTLRAQKLMGLLVFKLKLLFIAFAFWVDRRERYLSQLPQTAKEQVDGPQTDKKKRP